MTTLEGFQVDMGGYYLEDRGAPAGDPFGGGGGGQLLPGHQGVPAWLGNLLTQQETVRASDLPQLPELHEGELGPLLAGDWLTMLAPQMCDISASAPLWWRRTMEVVAQAYQIWLTANPLTRLG